MIRLAKACENAMWVRYAIEKNKVAIMLREEYKSKEELKQAVGNYTAKGFKVHWK